MVWMDERLERLGRVVLRALGMAAVVCTLLLAWPGVRAVRADEATTAPDASLQPAESRAPDASYEGFASFVESQRREARVVEAGGPTCNQSAAIAPEIAHQRAIAMLQARLIADMQARGADGQSPDVVVLNGSGYNYRPSMPGRPAVAPATPPAQ